MSKKIASTISGNKPQVIVDFSINERALYLELINLSDVPALNVAVTFSPSLIGLNRSTDLSALPLFKKIRFLAPFKKISVFVDLLDTFFSTNKKVSVGPNRTPHVFTISIVYESKAGEFIKETITHDLNIFNGLPPNSSTSRI